MRIVSLLPSATETLCALGLGDQIVGISHKCDFPSYITDRPQLTKSVLEENLPSDEIHRRVQEGANGGRRLYQLNSDLLKKLKPDLIVTQDQCSVCAIGKDDVEQSIRYSGCQADIVVLRATSFWAVLDDISKLGLAVERQESASRLIRRMQTRLHAVRRRIGLAQRPKVFCLSWFNPLMAASHWLTELVDLAGGKNDLSSTDGSSSPLDTDRLITSDPEAIFLMPCDFDLERTVREWQSGRIQAIFRGLSAVKNGRVYAVKGSIFHRPGPRLVDGVQLLASTLHPLRIRYGYSDELIRKVA